MRASLISIVATVCFLFGHVAGADFIFDFDMADRTFLGSGPLGTGAPDPVVAGAPVPGPGDFVPTLGSPYFLVGNLTNYCGLFPGNPVGSKMGTDCMSPMEGDLSGTINYDTGADTFMLSEDTLLQLQLIVKVGHPERPLGVPSRGQNQIEEFDIYLQSANSPVILELAQLLDDVNANNGVMTDDGEVSNGYYLYNFGTGIVPAGEWYPYFVSQHGSIEFLTQLSKPVPEPGTILLFASGLAGLAFAGWRRRRVS